MRLRYSYHSEHAAAPTARWVHFLLFLGAFLLFLAAAQQFFLWWTDWYATDEENGYYHLSLGLLYLLIGAVLTYAGYRRQRAARRVEDRYVRVTEDELRWHLVTGEAQQRIPLKTITGLERPNVRDLLITHAGGPTSILPIYLITHSAKQEELEKVLRSVVTENQGQAG